MWKLNHPPGRWQVLTTTIPDGQLHFNQMVKDFEIGGSNRHVQILNKVRSWGSKPNAFGDGIIYNGMPTERTG